MFGLFKQKMTASEFGHAVAHMAGDYLSVDAVRSLAMRFDDCDGSQGFATFLENKGMPIPIQKLHFRLFTHCAVQAASTQFGVVTRRAMTEGATLKGFSNVPSGYDFGTTFNTLEEAYSGQHEFDQMVEQLNSADAQLSFLPNPNVGVLNAKYLIESFVLPNMTNSQAFVEEFQEYSTTISTAVATVFRAMNDLSKSFKIS